MSRALVIKDVDFSTNKLDKITFSDAIHCTNIVLDESTLAITKIGQTASLTPTVTPANTTDIIYWESSDTDVVTVSNGVVTAVGIGTATVTATCGTQTATCAFTVTNELEFEYTIGRVQFRGDQSTKDYVFNQATDSNSYAALVSDVEAQKTVWMYKSDTMYPIKLGKGASQVSITVPNDIRPTVWFINSEEACTYSQSNPSFADYAKVISGDRSQYDSNVPLGNRTLTVPEGADSMVMNVQYPNNTVTDAIMATVSIVVS